MFCSYCCDIIDYIKLWGCDNNSPSKQQHKAHEHRREHRVQSADCNRGRHTRRQVLRMPTGKIMSKGEEKHHCSHSVSVKSEMKHVHYMNINERLN